MNSICRIWFAPLFGLFLCVPEVRTEAPPVTKIYPVHYADLQETLEIITAMMPSTNGLRMAGSSGGLAVTGTGEQHRFVAEMLSELDAHPKNVRIDVNFARSGQISRREAGIRPKGPVIIRDGEVSGAVQVNLHGQTVTARENVTQMLVASSGRSASLRVGERVPYLAWIEEYGRRCGYIREVRLEWREVGAFLAMEPTLIGSGPMIRIRLIPELSGILEDGTPQRIHFTGVATEVVVRDGETVSIGGFTENQDFYSRFLVGGSQDEESSTTEITLTPHILE
jgi:type II secretory pathway component GspD/PulD (secretin)